MIVIVDCGMGNLHSVEGGLRRAGGDIITSADTNIIDKADKVVLPGDGHFGACMAQIHGRGLYHSLLQAATSKPFLGICIGMQILYESSEEAPQTLGLGLMPGAIQKLSDAPKIPHIGWNTTYTNLTSAPIFLDGIDNLTRFYFIHSYYARPDDNTVLTTQYGNKVAAAIVKDNMMATQFHPEKSASQGARLLANFVRC